MVRRNAVLVGVIALCLALVAIVSLGSSILLAYKNAVAEQQRIKAENERSRAEQHLTIAREAIDTLLTKSASELKQSPGTSELQLQLLDNAVRFYEQFPADVSARPEIRFETSEAYRRVAQMCVEISKTEYRQKASVLLDRAITILESLIEQDGDRTDYQLALIRARLQVARLQILMAQSGHDYNGFEPDLTQRAVELAEKLVASQPSSRAYREVLAEAIEGHVRYSTFDLMKGRYRRATPAQVSYLAQACDLLAELAKEFPAEEEYRARLAACSATYVDALLSIGELARADLILQQQLETTRSLVSLAPGNRDYQCGLVKLLLLRCWVFHGRGHHKEADSLFEEALQTQENLRQLDPDSDQMRSTLLELLREQINSLLARKMFAEASQLQSKFLHYRRLEREYDSDNPAEYAMLRTSLYTHAMCLAELGREEEARQAYQECLEVAEQALAHAVPKMDNEEIYCVTYSVICPFPELRDDPGMYERARELLQEYQSKYPGSRLSQLLITLGWAACRAGRWEEALEAFAEVNTDDLLQGFWTEVDVETGKAVTLYHTGRQEESLRQLVLAHHKLQDGDRTVRGSSYYYLQGRNLLRQAVASCQLEEAGTLTCVDRLVQPRDNDNQDFDPAQRSVAIRDSQSCFQIAMLTAPIEIDGTPVVQVETSLTRDGKALREGSDYIVDVDPMGEILTIRPVIGAWGGGCYRISVQQTEFDVVIKNALPEVHELRLKSASDNRAPLHCRLFQQASVLVPKGSVWKYLDDGSDQGTAWREPAFDDSYWKSGPAQLGFGETDQATTISFGPDEWNKYATTYFRHQFEVTDPTGLLALQMHVLRDDGVAVYLNGREVFRDNLVPLADHRTYSQAGIYNSGETTFLKATINPNFLVQGTNCLAVEIHQQDPDSSDLSFDLILTAPQAILVTAETLFGTGESQIPAGSVIAQATVEVAGEGDASAISLIRLFDPESLGDHFTPEQRDTGSASEFNVQQTLQAWSDGEPNHGWALLQSDDANEQDVQLTVHFLSPQDAAQVAWLLATCADAPTRDPATALELAERAVKYADSDALSWAAYGAALYRAERWAEAVSTLTTAEGLPDAPSAVQVLRAMALWQLGNHDEARQLYDGVMEAVPSHSEDCDSLSLLIPEAASLMRIAVE